jgi:hypothetical protein
VQGARRSARGAWRRCGVALPGMTLALGALALPLTASG